MVACFLFQIYLSSDRLRSAGAADMGSDTVSAFRRIDWVHLPQPVVARLQLRSLYQVEHLQIMQRALVGIKKSLNFSSHRFEINKS